MHRMHNLILPATLIVGLSASVPLLLSGGLTWSQMASADPLYLALLSAFILAQWNLNALRSRALLSSVARDLSQRTALLYVMASDFALKSTPGGVAAPLLAISFLRKHQVPPATTVSALVLVHFLDLVLMFFVLSAGLAWASCYSDQHSVGPLLFATALSLLSIILLGALTIYHYRKVILFLGSMTNKLPHRLKRISVAAGRQLIRLKRSSNSFTALPFSQQLSIFFLSALFWILQCSALYLALRSLDVQTPWIIAASTQILAMAAGRLSLMPGGAATSELAAIATLSLWVPVAHAATAVLIWRASSLYVGLIAGGTSLAFLSRHSNILGDIERHLTPKRRKTEHDR